MEMAQIPAKVAAELQRQYNQELGAAHAYRALSLWCEMQNFKGFACYFDKQCTEEYAHAKKIAAHLVDRKASPELSALPAPVQKFNSLLKVAEHAHQMELSNTQGIHAV